MKIKLEIDETDARLLRVLDYSGDLESVIEQLIDHASQGIYRPGAWEREWLCQAFGYDWIEKLAPGDPYGRSGYEAFFQQPKPKN